LIYINGGNRVRIWVNKAADLMQVNAFPKDEEQLSNGPNGEEIDMTTITSLPEPCECIRCGARLTSPDRCTYLDEETACYLWNCHKCGCEFESSISLYPETPLTPEIVEEFLPNLLIA